MKPLHLAIGAGVLALGAWSLFSGSAASEALPKWRPGPSSRLISDRSIARYARAAGFTGEDLVTAVAVALAESTGYADAFLWNKHKKGPPSQDRGLWQINTRHHPEVSDGEAYDPALAARAAYRIWKKTGFTEWNTWKDGLHIKFMPRARKAVTLEGDVSGPARLPASELAKLAKDAGFKGQDLVVAVAVALAESEGLPTAKNADNIGLWQIASKIHKLDPAELVDPDVNVKTARVIYLDAIRRGKPGWWPWGAYRDQRYLEFLPAAQQAVRAA